MSCVNFRQTTEAATTAMENSLPERLSSQHNTTRAANELQAALGRAHTPATAKCNHQVATTTRSSASRTQHKLRHKLKCSFKCKHNFKCNHQ